MPGFNDRKIVIPKGIWDRDWDAILADRKGEERRLLDFQKRTAELLRDIPSQPATAERVAWMIFWVRSFTASLDTLSSLQAGSEQMLTILHRMCFEMEMQLGFIKKPLVGTKYPVTEAVWQKFLARFRAYTTWCLWADMSLLKEMIDPNAMEAVCDTGAAREILSDPVERQFVEEFFGGGDEFYRVAQDFNRTEVESGLTAKLHRVRELLDDPSLSVWKRRLETPPRPSSFFAMFDESEVTLAGRLRQAGLLFAYSLYKGGSLAIHGSSLDQFLYETTERSWGPRIVPIGKRDRNTAATIASHLDEMYLCLMLTKARVWETTEPQP